MQYVCICSTSVNMTWSKGNILKQTVRLFYMLLDLTRVLSAVQNIYRWGIFTVVFTLMYCKDTDIPVTSLPDRKSVW